jgi:hypothetical protein
MKAIISTKTVVCIFIVGLLAFATHANADVDRDVIQSNDMNTNNLAQTAGDLAYDSTALGLSSSLGDVDISDCLASKQISVLIIWQNQWLVENPLCVARDLDSIGAHIAAAKVRCATKTLTAAYPIESECIEAVKARPTRIPPPPPPLEITESGDDDDNEGEREEWREEQMAMQIDYDSRIAQIERQLSAPAPAPAPQIIEKTIVDNGADRRANSRLAYQEALTKGTEEDAAN